MTADRKKIPVSIRDSVLKEFNHRCAVCGADGPHLHHIDENPANNDARNLIPLCPNCHLTDQHDASNTTPQAKLHMFRRHKHRYILRPQFNPVFRRMTFLSSISDDDDCEKLEASATELIALVRNLTMGAFYGESLQKLLARPSHPWVWVPGDPGSDRRMTERIQREAEEYRTQLRRSAGDAELLIVEMLDYQTWDDPSS